ncbi:hypothetical protein Tco_1029097 [Tanacetum coccineum]|uniref:Uncharacterized protein n=1 Tax=Tanacetum coccineum TaxID=301880 RepID=A0ABQ5G2H2_9ASTR
MMTHLVPGTRLETRCDKESRSWEIVQEMEEETTKDTGVDPDKANSNWSAVTHPTTYLGFILNIVNKNHRSSASLIKAKLIDSKDTRVYFIDYRVRLWFTYLNFFKKRFPCLLRTSISDQLANNLHDVMMETLPSSVTTTRHSNLDDHNDDAHHEGLSRKKMMIFDSGLILMLLMSTEEAMEGIQDGLRGKCSNRLFRTRSCKQQLKYGEKAARILMLQISDYNWFEYISVLKTVCAIAVLDVIFKDDGSHNRRETCSSLAFFCSSLVHLF